MAHTKDLVYEHKTDIICRTFSAATRITDQDALPRITRGETGKIICTDAENGHLEHLLIAVKFKDMKNHPQPLSVISCYGKHVHRIRFILPLPTL